MTKTSLFLLICCLAIFTSCGGGSSSNRTGDNSEKSNPPVTGPISSRPWQGTWVQGVSMSMVFSKPGATAQNAYQAEHNFTVNTKDCAIEVNLHMATQAGPDDDTLGQTFLFRSSAGPHTLGCECKKLNHRGVLEGSISFPQDGGLTLHMDRGLDQMYCAGAPIFADGFESGDTSAWTREP